MGWRFDNWKRQFREMLSTVLFLFCWFLIVVAVLKGCDRSGGGDPYDSGPPEDVQHDVY